MIPSSSLSLDAQFKFKNQDIDYTLEFSVWHTLISRTVVFFIFTSILIKKVRFALHCAQPLADISKFSFFCDFFQWKDLPNSVIPTKKKSTQMHVFFVFCLTEHGHKKLGQFVVLTKMYYTLFKIRSFWNIAVVERCTKSPLPLSHQHTKVQLLPPHRDRAMFRIFRGGIYYQSKLKNIFFLLFNRIRSFSLRREKN